MEVLEAIRDRRSIRRYDRRDVPEEKLMQVLEAGRWAPSAHNSQPRKFVVIRDEETRKQLARIAAYGGFLADAPVAIAVVIDPSSSNHPVEDGAAATQNMLLAAHAVGIGSCWIGAYGSGYEAKARRILGVPVDKRLLSLISLGYAADSGSSTRVELSKLICFERFQ
ncbi:MAG: nitroreductase family protein [Dehalococcoidia bacterium]|nr:nitroreductase family protein [Dehalococcoidia bacterium]